jgi:hypothetical protein
MLVSGSFVTLSASNSKVSDLGENTHAENRSNRLYTAVECIKFHDNQSFDVNRSIMNITPPEPVIDVVNNSTDSDYDNSTISNDSDDDNSVENFTVIEPVVESCNLVTVYAQASSYMDSDYPGGVWYKVVWDKDLLDSYYGYCEFNPKGVYESEITVMAHGRYYSCDFSALTGWEKSQSGCSDWSNPKYVGGAIVSVSSC